ncbi:MAG: hypothetical protein ACRED5_09600 [Propylenella sp.]
MTTESPHNITLAQFTAVFVPAGLLLAWALIAPELGGDLEVGRSRDTMWAVVLLVLASMVLYPFRNESQRIANLSYLLWTAGLLVFVVHAYWGFFYYYGSIADAYRGQGPEIFIPNTLVLLVWMIDTALLWFARESRAGALFHVAVRVLFFLFFAVDMIVTRVGAPKILGFVFVGIIAAAWLLRLARTRMRATA